MRITLKSENLPSWLYNQLAAMSEEERNRYATDALERGFKEKSLRRGVDQANRGEGLPLEESRAEAHAEFTLLIAEHQAAKEAG
jgi:hypothetical protein